MARIAILTVAAHQDKRLDIERGTVIGALSVYPSAAVVPRELELLSTDGNKQRQVIALPQGSLFLLGDRTNQEFQHSVRPATAATTVASARRPGSASPSGAAQRSARRTASWWGRVAACACWRMARCGGLATRGGRWRCSTPTTATW